MKSLGKRPNVNPIDNQPKSLVRLISMGHGRPSRHRPARAGPNSGVRVIPKPGALSLANCVRLVGRGSVEPVPLEALETHLGDLLGHQTHHEDDHCRGEQQCTHVRKSSRGHKGEDVVAEAQ